MDWLATDPTGSGDPDVLIMGDLNSYALEDPMCGSSLGSGKLYDWNSSTLTWDYVQEVSYVISFVDGGSSKKRGGAKPDHFGIILTDFSDPGLPESAPQRLKGGNVTVP